MSNKPSKLQQQLNWFLSLVVILLLFIIPPLLCSLLYLSRVPDVTWERSDGITYDRIWLYREQRPVGIAYQTRRIIAKPRETERCVENELRFFLWRKSERAEPATTSQKMALVEGQWQPTGEACQ
jgi:hypothetical protein